MTEAEWLACTDLGEAVYAEAPPQLSERKQCLFRVACCRRVWHLILFEHSRNAVEVAERYADGKAEDGELDEAICDAEDGYDAGTPPGMEGTPHLHRAVTYAIRAAYRTTDSDRGYEPGPDVASAAAYAVAVSPGDAAWENAYNAEMEAHRSLLHCIFGNPYRPVRLDPGWLAWNGGAIPALAHAVYEERAFDRLPILADALEDAGCTDRAVLDHLRGPGPHVRGCWVVDLVLGKQ